MSREPADKNVCATMRSFMKSQFIPLLRNEVTKATRRKLSWFGIFMVGLACVIVYFIAGQLSNAATANAWGYVGFSMQIVFTTLARYLSSRCGQVGGR